MERAWTIALGGVLFGVAVGAAGAWRLAQPAPASKHNSARSPEDTVEPDSLRPPSPPVVGPARAGLSDDDNAALRALVQQEVRAAMATRPGPASMAPQGAGAAFAQDASTDEILAQLPRDQQSKYAAAESLVHDAISRGHWSDDDRWSLRSALRDVPDELRPRVMLELVRAANQGEVKRDGRGPLF